MPKKLIQLRVDRWMKHKLHSLAPANGRIMLLASKIINIDLITFDKPCPRKQTLNQNMMNKAIVDVQSYD